MSLTRRDRIPRCVTKPSRPYVGLKNSWCRRFPSDKTTSRNLHSMGKLLHRDVLAKLTRGSADHPRVWQTPAVAPPSRLVRILAACLAEWFFLVPPALANPQGGVVHGGSAVITGQGTPAVTVHQFSKNAVLSWQTFNIQHGETTNFQQPSANAVAINRILDGQASTILGSLNATGHVYLINPNGILFGKGSSVNVYALAAATSAKAGQVAAQSRDGFDPRFPLQRIL